MNGRSMIMMALAVAATCASVASAHDGVHAPDDSPYTAVPGRAVILQQLRLRGVVAPRITSATARQVRASGKVGRATRAFSVDVSRMAISDVSRAGKRRGVAMTPAVMRRVPFQEGAAMVDPALLPIPLP